MKSSPLHQSIHNRNLQLQQQKNCQRGIGRLIPTFAILFTFFLLYSLISSIKTTPKPGLSDQQNLVTRPESVKTTPKSGFSDQQNLVTRPENVKAITKQGYSDLQNLLTSHENVENCNLFRGRWVWDPNGSLYTNQSCLTIPDSKNCGKHGRVDSEYLNWRWKPDGCELQRFEPETFLKFVHGKKLAFIGDSVARNHMESLLCLLSTVETPLDVYKDSDDRVRHWYFPSHDFTLMVLWTKFLVVAKEREVNGSLSGVFDIYLDKLDTNWTKHIHELDFAIISDGHWFFRKSYFYERNKLVGCLYCDGEHITEFSLGLALRKAFRSTLSFIGGRCENCKPLVTLVRTFSPAHFENGVWNNGGNCNRTRPISEDSANLKGMEWEIRNIQVEELERIRGRGLRRERKFRVLDVTKAMLMRPDGHPGSHWNSKWMQGFNDCVHWCLPGPIDAWNDLLLEILKRESSYF